MNYVVLGHHSKTTTRDTGKFDINTAFWESQNKTVWVRSLHQNIQFHEKYFDGYQITYFSKS